MPFIRWLFLGIVVFACAARAATPPDDRVSSVKVEWARLKTGSPYWDRHSERDLQLLRQIRTETSLEIADTWHPARASEPDELSQHPFIFSEGLASLTEPELGHVAEYLRRGGFLLIDACVAVSINPDAQRFLDTQVQMLARKIPELRVGVLNPEHEVFSIYFKMAQFPPQTRSGSNPRWANGSTEPLRAVFLGDRMIAVISLSGFQCGFGQNPRPGDVIRMVTNIYIYAMSR